MASGSEETTVAGLQADLRGVTVRNTFIDGADGWDGTDLRGVKVRNTFIECSDGWDGVFPDEGPKRQNSEPAKPLGHEASEFAAWASFGYDAPFEMKADYASHDNPATRASMGSGGCYDAATVAFNQMLSAGKQLQQKGGSSRLFCPHCGAEADPVHKFCPYCCFQLHQAPSTAGATAAAASKPTPNLLSCLRRFRYVEASPEDVEAAHAICRKAAALRGDTGGEQEEEE